MAQIRLSEKGKAEIVKLRGLGYSQEEIANRLGISQSAVQYQLKKINERARKEGEENTFFALLAAAGVGMGIGYALAKYFENKDER